MERDRGSRIEEKIRARPRLAKAIAIGSLLIFIGFPGGQLLDALSDGAYRSGSHIITRDGNPAAFLLYVARAGVFFALSIGLAAWMLYKRITQRRS